ncbi:MAG: NAD(P)H-hydrate dehydratase [Balneolaceae bacterium]
MRDLTNEPMMTLIQNPYQYKICSASQSREADRLTIEKFGLSGNLLMETAGLQAARWISGKTREGSNGLYICGKGNNAGDALVIARYLAMHNRHNCTLLMLSGEEDLSPDSDKNLSHLKSLSHQGITVNFIDNLNAIPNENWNYIIDGMLGTGLTSDLRSPYDQAVNWINTHCHNSLVYAIDIPTGLHADHGKIMGDAVRANATLSFGARKLGFYFNAGIEVTGKIIQFYLSFPENYLESTATVLLPELEKELPSITRLRQHKYSEGVLYIIAGSEGLTGAAIMSARSAWKSGVGAVFLITPKGLLSIYEKTLPEIIKMPVGAYEDTYFSTSHSDSVLNMLNQHEGTLLIGPGLGRKRKTLDFTKNILNNFQGSVVVDADALLSIQEAEKPDKSTWIITPHPGEVRHLDKQITEDFGRLSWANKFSTEHEINVVSKGSPTIVSTREGELYITGYDTRIFSRAGFGDVLSGKIAGFLTICKDVETSTIHALLDGYHKASDKKIEEPETSVEPQHLL